MPSSGPIPIPLRLRWQHLRLRILPVLVFGGAVVGSAWLWRDHSWQAGSVVGIARGRVCQISSAYAGRIGSIPVRLLDHVVKGQVVAVLDDDLLTAKIATIRHEIERLRADYERERGVLLADVANRQAGWAADDRAFAGDIVQLKTRILELQAALAEDRELLKGLDLEVQNALGLVRDNAMSQVELERAKANQAATSAKIRANEDALAQLETQVRQAQDREGAYSRHTPVTPSEETDLENLHKAISVQEGLIRELEAQRAQMTLMAPFDGVVVEIQPRSGESAMRRPGEGIIRREGETVNVGDPILAIAETSPTEIVAYADERRMDKLHEGLSLEIRTRDQAAQQGLAQVSAVAPTVERLPERLWASPQSPTWGRPFMASIPPGMKLSPGELVWVRLP